MAKSGPDIEARLSLASSSQPRKQISCHLPVPADLFFFFFPLETAAAPSPDTSLGVSH